MKTEPTIQLPASPPLSSSDLLAALERGETLIQKRERPMEIYLAKYANGTRGLHLGGWGSAVTRPESAARDLIENPNEWTIAANEKAEP